MGLGDAVVMDNGDGGGQAGKVAPVAVSCSICLEEVMENGGRSWTKLQCGHQFHLDCIGSAFNVKGAMQCPNCRKIEKGQWLYALGSLGALGGLGSHVMPEFNMDFDFAFDDDPYEGSYSEMAFGVHWCPISGLTRFPSSFDEGEFSSNPYHDHLGRHAMFSEHAAVSALNSCPYIAYFEPVHSSSTSSGSVSDGSNFNSHWSGPSAQNEMPGSYAFPGMDVHYHSWELPGPFGTSSRIGGADQPSIVSVTQRALQATSDIPRPLSMMRPFYVHSLPISTAASMFPPYPGSVARPLDRVQALHAYSQQANGSLAAHTPLVPPARRYNNRSGLTQVPSAASSSGQSGSLYLLSGSSGRAYQEPEALLSDRFYAWEGEHVPSVPFSQVDGDSIWGPFHPAAGGSDAVTRPSGARQRHGSERTAPSQNHRS